MDLTDSYLQVVPDEVLARFEFRETRMAARIIGATNPDEYGDVLHVLSGFVLTTPDLIDSGGNESKLAARLNEAFRSRGWREGRVDTRIGLELALKPYKDAGETGKEIRKTEVLNGGYQVDNVKGRIALVEWNAKDGNLDRDIGAYRALYDAGLIDAAVMISRTQEDLRPLAARLAEDVGGMSTSEARRRLVTTTTTNYDKLMPRVTRGDLGGCPFLAIFICARTWEGA